MFPTINRVIELILYILPAYVANGAPVLFGGGKPLDFGKNFFDGRRIFGDHKTIRGLVSGILSGIFIGVIIYAIRPSGLLTLCDAIWLPIGTHIGDLFGSFIKRRADLKPGKSAPILDQLGFLYFALLFSWVFCNTLLSLIDIAVLTIITLLLHPLTNLGAYILKLKRVPY